MPSGGHVVALDLEPVSLDLEIVPLPDVLAFRAEHLEQHRRYRRDLMRFLAELASIADLHDRERAIVDRREEVADEARTIQRETRRAFGKNLAELGIGSRRQRVVGRSSRSGGHRPQRSWPRSRVSRRRASRLRVLLLVRSSRRVPCSLIRTRCKTVEPPHQHARKAQLFDRVLVVERSK